MRIAWFTPFWRNSAIGAFSALVAPAIARHAHVELWVPETVDAHPTDLPVVRFGPDDVDWERLHQAEVAVYNAGNNSPFHQAVMSAARAVPGVMVLHDSVMHHYYLDEARFGAGALGPYLDALERWYGPDVAAQARAHLGATPFVGYPPDGFTADYPLIEEATLGALGLVLHADSQVARLQPHWVGPIARLDLASAGAELAIGDVPLRPPADDGRLRALSFGLVGSPKQIHLVLDALAARPDLRERVHYKVAGPYDPNSEYFHQLSATLARHDLDGAVEFLGYVSDEELAELTDWADAFLNLRWPSTEGGSASLTQQLITGRPVVVSPSGIFDEVPDDAAIKIRSQDAAGVAHALERLLEGPELRRSIGSNGRRHARRFSADAYARGILAMAEEARRWRPVVRFVDRVGDTLRELGAADGMRVLDTVGAEIAQMFGAEFSQDRGAGGAAPERPAANDLL